MKRVNNIYHKICDLDNIVDFAHLVSTNTKNKMKIEKFDEYYAENIYYIKGMLDRCSYIPGKYNIFLVHEPKLRIIMSQAIVDKVVNHLVANYFLVDVFDSSFIETSIATRKNKGTHYGIKLTKKYLNEMKSKYDNFYVLKFDVKKYFYNIDHEITKGLIRKKIKDERALKILDTIIDTTDEKYINETIDKIKSVEIKKIENNNFPDKKTRIAEVESLPYYKCGKGFPIGNMSSQMFAILYLNELDHFIKEKLHIKYYIRYMDDGVLIHHDKEYLKYCLKEIEKILFKYKLELNSKTKIDSIKNGLDFLGFRFYIINGKVIMKLRNSTKKRFKKRAKVLNELLNSGKITRKEYDESLASYKGHLKWGNCTNLFNKNYEIEIINDI